MIKITSLFVILFVALSFNAFSQNNIDLNYKYSSTPVNYLHNQNIHESLDIQGQTMDVHVSIVMECNVKSVGNQNDLVALSVTIDTLAEVVDSPQGMMGGGIGEVEGKSFNMTIKSNGKLSDIAGAKNTTYNVPGQGPNNLSGTFADFFPTLPGGKVSPGYIWTSVDTVSNEAGMNSQITIMNSENKFEGFEEVAGMNCAKISSATSGTSNMKNEVQGMSMQTTGNFTGTSITWFFPEAGYFVKFTSTTKMTGNVVMQNEGYSFPVVMDIIESTELGK